MQNFIDIIKERGFVHQMTDEDGLRKLLETKGQTAYIGFDCTAKSLHVGSLLQIMLLRWWQKCGHRPIVLLGGGTTKIGDPSGKDAARPKLDDAAIAENMESLKQVFAKFIEFGDGKALMVNNDDWLKDINYIEFLRDYGRHFSVNRMLTMDSVKLRLEREQPLSFLEFNYMILQAYDFLELYQRYGCRLQFGGSDQWGNIIQGVNLVEKAVLHLNNDFHPDDLAMVEEICDLAKVYKSREEQPDLFNIWVAKTEHFRKASKSHRPMLLLEHKLNKIGNYPDFFGIFGITSPLLTTSSGAKMGKTAAGAVWLNADLVSPYDYWQYWRNTEDGDVIRFLKLFTELPLPQIAEYEAWVGSSKINEAKIILATEATALLHGREEAEKAARTAAETFSGSGVSENLPTIEITRNEFEEGANLIRWLVKADFAASNGEARRLIEGNGISLNDAKVTDANYKLTTADFAQGFAKLSKGKKQHVLVKLA